MDRVRPRPQGRKATTFKVPKQAYTAKFKTVAVQWVKDVHNASAMARELGMSEQTLRNWIKASEARKLNGAVAKVVTPEQRVA